MTISSQDTAGGASSAMGVSPVNLRDSRFGLNTANWQSTGVINNLPPRMSDVSSNHMTPAQLQRSSQQKDQESFDNAKAAELALRELLDSLEAARYSFCFLPKFLSMLTLSVDVESHTRMFSTSTFAP
jgi:hypothetical protein